MITYPQIARAFYLEPLALDEATMLSIHMWLWPRISGKISEALPTEAEMAAGKEKPIKSAIMPHTRRSMASPVYDFDGRITDDRYYYTVDGKPSIAVIPVNGMLAKGAGFFQEVCMGAVNTDRISHALNQAVAAKEVKDIVFDFGSPGGKTTGIPELGAQIKAATEVRGKTLYAFTDSLTASAAEWLASQCDEVLMTPSSQVGSIGTYLAFLNPKVAMQMQGYSLELFAQGTHKGIGLPGRDLTQADRGYLQGIVNDLNAQFVAAVKGGRPKASEEALRDAKVYDGPTAMKHGLADGLVANWDEFISAL